MVYSDEVNPPENVLDAGGPKMTFREKQVFWSQPRPVPMNRCVAFTRDPLDVMTYTPFDEGKDTSEFHPLLWVRTIYYIPPFLPSICNVHQANDAFNPLDRNNDLGAYPAISGRYPIKIGVVRCPLHRFRRGDDSEKVGRVPEGYLK